MNLCLRGTLSADRALSPRPARRALSRRRVVVRRRPHQRVLAEPLLLRVDVGAVRPQQLHGLGIASSARPTSTRLPFAQRGVGVGACLSRASIIGASPLVAARTAASCRSGSRRRHRRPRRSAEAAVQSPREPPNAAPSCRRLPVRSTSPAAGGAYRHRSMFPLLTASIRAGSVPAALRAGHRASDTPRTHRQGSRLVRIMMSR